MRVYVKYMVSFRCKERVREELGELGIVSIIDQGTVECPQYLTPEQVFKLKESIWELGFEIVDEEQSYLLDHISEAIDMLIRLNTRKWGTDYPRYLADKMRFDYEEVSKLFLQVYGLSLSRYVELQKIERAKEVMLQFKELTMAEVAEMSRFEDLDYFLNTFKDNTGLEPLYYQKIKKKESEIELENNFAMKEIPAFKSIEKNIFTQYREYIGRLREIG